MTTYDVMTQTRGLCAYMSRPTYCNFFGFQQDIAFQQRHKRIFGPLLTSL